MIDQIVWNPITGSSQSFNTDEDPFPVLEFDVTPDYRMDNSRQKPGQHSVYATPSERDGMSIDISLGILADDASDYVTKRAQLVNRLNGENFLDYVTEDILGTLSITLTGQSEAWDADCIISAFSGPKSGTEGAYSQVLVTFYSFAAYFYGHDDNTNLYRWS